MAIGSGVSMAVMVLFLRKQKDDSPLESILIGNIFTAIIALPFMLQSSPSLSDLGTLTFLGIIQLGFPYMLYAIAIKHVSAMEAVLVPVIEPIMNPVWVYLSIGEMPGKWGFLGGAIVLLAVTVRCMILSTHTHTQENSSS